MKQIDKFWNWFLANEEAIIHAIRFGINFDEIFLYFNRHFTGISKRIGFMIKLSNYEEKHTIVFSAGGYPKLFAKIRALEQQAPKLLYFTPQAFIKPLQDKTAIMEGRDSGYGFGDYNIRISQLYLSMDQYDLPTKRLRITIYLPAEYDDLRMYDDNLECYLTCIVIDIVGEVAFRKHIRAFQIAGVSDSKKGLLKLIELQDCIDHLCQIDARRKTRSL